MERNESEQTTTVPSLDGEPEDEQIKAMQQALRKVVRLYYGMVPTTCVWYRQMSDLFRRDDGSLGSIKTKLGGSPWKEICFGFHVER